MSDDAISGDQVSEPIDDGESVEVAGAVMTAPKIFISYRRQDSTDVVETLAERFRSDLGSSNVFRDQDDLIVGQRWQDALDRSIAKSDAAVFVVGENWCGLAADGTPRIEQAEDPVRREVGRALAGSKCQPLPVLVDVDGPPTDIPSDVEGLFEHHYVVTTRDELLDDTSRDYQRVLVGVWESLRQQTADGVLIIGDAIASLDALVEELIRTDQIESRELSRFASGAYVVSARQVRKAKKRWPDVIVVVDNEPSPVLGERIRALDEHPTVRNLALAGVGAAAALASGYVATAAGGLSSLGTTVTTSAAVSSVVPASSAGPLTAASAIWANAAVGAKAAMVAGAVAVTAGGGVAVKQLVDDDGPPDELFAQTTTVEPLRTTDDSFPLGEPGDARIVLGEPQPVGTDETTSYFGNFEGGEAERRSATVSFDGTEIDLGDVVVPVRYPSDYLELNDRLFRITSVTSDGDIEFADAGMGAESPCVFQGTGDTVGAWQYTGEPGSVRVEFLIDSDGTSVIGVGMVLTFEGPADVDFFEDVVAEVIPPDVDLTDRCTPIERLPTRWGSGVALDE